MEKAWCVCCPLRKYMAKFLETTAISYRIWKLLKSREKFRASDGLGIFDHQTAQLFLNSSRSDPFFNPC